MRKINTNILIRAATALIWNTRVKNVTKQAYSRAATDRQPYKMGVLKFEISLTLLMDFYKRSQFNHLTNQTFNTFNPMLNKSIKVDEISRY